MARRSSTPNVVRWLGVAAPLALVAAIGLGALLSPEEATGSGGTAPPFTLPDTHGGEQSLDAALADGPALLYFSMGAGCDGCFVQIPEIAEGVAERDLEFVPIMPGDPQAVVSEAQRLGVADPILLDTSVEVAEAYDMLGHYGHDTVPGHSFALVTEEREIAWVEHYAEMFVPSEEFFPALDEGLETIR